jgi:ligand-binding sensor domain-containing protein
MTIDGDGNLWFGIEGGLRKLDGTTATDYLDPSSRWRPLEVAQLVADNSGNIWFSIFTNHSEGIGKFDGENWTFYIVSSDGVSNDKVNALAVDDSGNIWCGTDFGVSRFDGAVWESFTSSDSGLVEGRIESIVIDDNGNIWFGSYAYGVSKYGLVYCGRCGGAAAYHNHII